jgi:formiminoglutamate deiminase
MSDAYWCELAWLGCERAEPGVVVEVEGARFAAVTAGVAAPPAGATRLAGLTLPGFANAHSHAFQRALRGRTHGGEGSFWTWREGMYALAARLDPELYRSLARATFAEMALAGITAVGEFHYLHHDAGGARYADANTMGEALITAAAEAGIRITLLDACYLQGGIGEQLNVVQRRFSDGDAGSWAERVEALAAAHPADDPVARVGAAIHSVRAVDPGAAARVARWAAERSCPLHAHVSEQPAENRACQAVYERSPTALLAEAGALEAAFTAVHATHVDERDIALLAAGSARCCLCPTTERDLADGIGPTRALVDAGVGLALGTDSHALIDMLEEARALELDERLASGVRGGHGAAELLRAATEEGHASIGWPEAGRIAPDACADLTTVAIDGVRLAGTTPEVALESVVFAGAACDVTQVLSGGHWIVRDGRHVEIDAAAELDRAIAALAA